MDLKRWRRKRRIRGFGVKRPYVNKRNRLMLGSGKKTRDGSIFEYIRRAKREYNEHRRR